MSIDYLYRIFYVILAMDLVAIALFPVMLVLRFIMRNMHRKYVVWLWRLYFFRIICPVSLSSVFCIVPTWNRAYHRVLALTGLEVQGEYGFLTGWHTVFETGIQTTIPYRVYAFAWMAGMITLLVVTRFRQTYIRQEMERNAVQLEGRIYQSAVPSPVMAGLLRPRYYLPRQVDAKQLRYLLPHLEAQRSRKSQWWRLLWFLILLLHWQNPFVWGAYALAKRDEELACDDLTVQRLGEQESIFYAQNLLNMAKEGVVLPYTVSTIFETDLERRAARMLYYRPSVPRQRMSAALILSLLVLWSFGMRPLQMAWDGGTWGQGGEMQSEARSRQPDSVRDVVAKCAVQSPNGLDLLLQLVMTGGEYSDKQYKGRFALELTDSMGDVLDTVSLKQSWKEQELPGDTMVFPENLLMQTGDYNGDGAQELLLGQQMDWTEEQASVAADAVFQTEQDAGEEEYIYLVYSIGEKDLTVVSDPVYALGERGKEAAVPLTEGMVDLFAVPVPEGRNYYVWDMDKQRYQREKMTQEMLNQHKAAAGGTGQAGARETETLKDDGGTVQMSVETRSDTTGSSEIQSVAIGSGQQPKKMNKVEGYYCDLQWAVCEDGTDDRYAVLTYNGTKAQTFIVYDVKQQKEYYRQEDGNDILAKAFKQYNGADISFAEGGVAVYSLQSKKEDTLTISFAADADNGVTVRGTYQYHIKNKGITDLSFSQAMDQANHDKE